MTQSQSTGSLGPADLEPSTLRQKIEKQGFALTSQGPDDSSKVLAEQLETHRILVKESGIELKSGRRRRSFSLHKLRA